MSSKGAGEKMMQHEKQEKQFSRQGSFEKKGVRSKK
jgi:hypothetical protein